MVKKGMNNIEVPPLCRETSVSRPVNVGTVGKNGLTIGHFFSLHAVLERSLTENLAQFKQNFLDCKYVYNSFFSGRFEVPIRIQFSVPNQSEKCV